jgi:inositol phosphorylceramide mannosyltransferase catalytic subunit
VIPKVFHTVWVQGEPLPETHTEWLGSWKKHNPTWAHVVWGENDYIGFLENREIYGTAVNHAQRAEIAQKEILWKYGGVYVDADFECFRPCTQFFEVDRVVTWDESPGQLGNQLIGSPQHHPAVRAALDDIPRSIMWQREQGLPQPYGAGPHLIQRLWRNRVDVEIRDSKEFFPYLWDQPKPSSWGDAYGAHHWTASWKQ